MRAASVVFAAVFFYGRHWLMDLGVTISLLLLGFYALIRWRAACVVARVLLRPRDPAARLIDMPAHEARRLVRFLSASLLAVTVLLAFGRYGLEDVDSGAPHIIGLIVAALVCGIYALIAWRARAMAEALIGGEDGGLFARCARRWPGFGCRSPSARSACCCSPSGSACRSDCCRITRQRYRPWRLSWF